MPNKKGTKRSSETVSHQTLSSTEQTQSSNDLPEEEKDSGNDEITEMSIEDLKNFRTVIRTKLKKTCYTSLQTNISANDKKEALQKARNLSHDLETIDNLIKLQQEDINSINQLNMSTASTIEQSNSSILLPNSANQMINNSLINITSQNVPKQPPQLSKQAIDAIKIIPLYSDSKDPHIFVHNIRNAQLSFGFGLDEGINIARVKLHHDGQLWLNDLLHTSPSLNWNAFETAFLKHYSSPNIIAEWEAKLNSLQAKDNNIADYTDSFRDLCSKLGWDESTNWVVTKYFNGLPRSIQQQLSPAMNAVNFINANNESNKSLSVKALSEMAITESARQRTALAKHTTVSTPSTNSTSTLSTGFKNKTKQYDPSKYCNYCQINGHTQSECRKFNNQQNQQKQQKQNKNTENNKTQKQILPQQTTVTATKFNPSKPIICNKCKEPGHYANNCTNRTTKTFSLDSSTDCCLSAPCTINGLQLKGLVDTGTSHSLIDQSVVLSLNLPVQPATGHVYLALEQFHAPRIGTITAEIKHNNITTQATFEVAQLHHSKLILGMDLLPTLGIEIQGISLNWPTTPPPPAPPIPQDDVLETHRNPELSSAVGPDNIAYEWLPSLERNAALPEDSVCNLPYSTVSIHTDGNPSFTAQYTVELGHGPNMDTQINEWIRLKRVIPAPDDSPWNSPVLPVNKMNPDTQLKTDTRTCLDFRNVNKTIPPTNNSMPNPLLDIITKLGSFKWITTIDLKDCYHQFLLNEEDRIKTTFTYNSRRYMFRVAPFGLKILSGHVQRVVDRLFATVEGLVAYQDDMTIVSKTEAEHITKVKLVLDLLTAAGLRINFRKCKWFQISTTILGLLVSRDGIQMDPAKVTSILNWNRPSTGKEMQSFLGAANFNRIFSHKFADFAAPLDQCRNMKTITWTPELIEAFERVKAIFAEDIHLRHIDWNKPFILTTDASLVGVGAWLGQIDENNVLQPVFCASSKLNPTQQRWPATKRELYALVWACEHLRHYLLGRKFIARVDHKPLLNILDNKVSRVMEHWFDKLQEFDFTTSYLPGEENQLADALSRSVSSNNISISHQDRHHEAMIWEAER
jgi:predicted aspartyl protease